MDVALSDLLTCPRCGPTYGLILLPDEVVGRRVVAGVLGCANCRERYPVVGGVADLRVGADPDADPDVDPDADVDADPEAEADLDVDPEAVLGLAALLDLSEAGGTVLLAGPGAYLGVALSRLVSEVRVVVDGGVGGGEVSVLRSDAGLPLRGGSMRGVSLTGVRSELVEEGARLLGPAGRLVLDPAPERARSRVEAAGLRVLLEEGGVLVAGRVR